MKERFTSEEWEMLKTLPLIAFGVVAGADGKIDQKEAAEMTKRLQSGAVGYKDPLHREVAAAILRSDLPTLIAAGKSVDPRSIKSFLQQKLTRDEYLSFMGSILIDMLAVARASGGLFTRSNVSDEESSVLAAFAALFEIDIDAVKKIFGA
jgi:hypothetical protein